MGYRFVLTKVAHLLRNVEQKILQFFHALYFHHNGIRQEVVDAWSWCERSRCFELRGCLQEVPLLSFLHNWMFTTLTCNLQRYFIPKWNWCVQSGTTSHYRTCSLMPDNVWGVLGKFDQLDGHSLSRQEKGAKCKGYAYFRNLGRSHQVKVSYWLRSYSKSNRNLYQHLTETFDYAATCSYAIPVQNSNGDCIVFFAHKWNKNHTFILHCVRDVVHKIAMSSINFIAVNTAQKCCHAV